MSCPLRSDAFGTGLLAALRRVHKHGLVSLQRRCDHVGKHGHTERPAALRRVWHRAARCASARSQTRAWANCNGAVLPLARHGHRSRPLRFGAFGTGLLAA
eukprot:1878069-Lingulodinium_polyedra.AAC.1